MAAIPPDIDSTNIVGFGTTGVVAVLPCARKIIKFPHSEPDARARCEVEVKVYERLEQTLLEYAEVGSLREYLRTADKQSKTLLLRWAQQAAQALAFCHASTILHGDINCSNLFLDGEQNLKLGDFAGSSIYGSPATICYSTTHQLPVPDSFFEAEDVMITKDTEIFAFGSNLYEMVTGRPPYDDKSDSEVERLFSSKEYTTVSDDTVLGSVILKCWNLEFCTMEEVLRSIERHEGTQPLSPAVMMSTTLTISIAPAA